MARKKKIDKEMGFRLKKARTDQKLTYEELAEKSGVSSRYIKEIENHGYYTNLYKSSWQDWGWDYAHDHRRLCNAYGCGCEW